MVRSGTIVLGAGTAVHQRGRLLVVRRAEEPHIGLWAFPGGRVEAGESPAETAVRETKEEVGLDVEIQRILDVVTYLPRELGRGNWNQVVLIDYLARPLGGAIKLNAESSDYRWVFPRDLELLATTTQMKECARKFADLREHDQSLR